MDNNIMKTQKASEREETEGIGDKCIEGLEDTEVRVMPLNIKFQYDCQYLMKQILIPFAR